MEPGQWVVKNHKERWGYAENEMVCVIAIEAEADKDGFFDMVLVRSSGQRIVSNTRYYREATENEIKGMRLRELFDK